MAHRRKSPKKIAQAQARKTPYVEQPSHHTNKSRQSSQQWKGAKMRPVLASPKLATAQAKRMTTINVRDYQQKNVNKKTAKALKSGVMGMAAVVNARPEQMKKLKAMSQQKLANLYQMNSRIFEVYYSYNGVEYDPEYGNEVNEDKRKNVDFLISEYEKVYGVL